MNLNADNCIKIPLIENHRGKHGLKACDIYKQKETSSTQMPTLSIWRTHRISECKEGF